MKKLLLLLIPIFFLSCNKQEEQPEEESLVLQEETVQAVELIEPEIILPQDIILTESEESEQIDTILSQFLEQVQTSNIEALKELFIPEQVEEYRTTKDYTFRHMFSNRQAYYGAIQTIVETGRTIDLAYETEERRGTYAEVSFRIENEKAVSLELIKLYRPITEEGFYMLGYRYSLEE